MRIIVTAQALFDEGDVAWGYHHEEVIVTSRANVDPQEVIASIREGKKLGKRDQEKIDEADRRGAAQTLDALVDHLEKAKESLLDQAAAEMIDSEA